MASDEIAALRGETEQALRRVRSRKTETERALSELDGEEKRLEQALKALGSPASGRSSTTSRPPAAAKVKAPGKTKRRAAAKRKPTAKPAAKKPAAKESSLTSEDRQRQMLELLADKEMSRAEIAERMGLSKVRIQQLMTPLIDAGRVTSRQDPNWPRPRSLWTAKKPSESKRSASAKRGGRRKAKK